MKRARVARFCEPRSDFGQSKKCEAYFARKARYEASLVEENERLALLAVESPLEACSLRAKRTYQACRGETPLGAAHPDFRDDDGGVCRDDFDIAVKMCGVRAQAEATP